MNAILNFHSHFSILNAVPTPQEIVDYCEKKNIKVAGLTDRHNISASFKFHKGCKDKGIKPVLGCELLVRDDESNHFLTVIARNKVGWSNLLKIVSDSNKEENIIARKLKKKVTYFPSITLDMLKESSDGLICRTGGVGSKLSMLQLRNEPHQYWVDHLKSIFTDGVYTTSDSGIFYLEKHDHEILKILLSSLCGSSISTLSREIVLLADPLLESLSRQDDYYVKDVKSDIDEIVEKIEEYEITNKPLLPNFPTPNNESQDDFLYNSLRDGWTKRSRIEWDRQVYGDRIKREFDIFKRAGLSGYFLIVKDFLDEFRSRGYITGGARGSVSGCLSAFLLGITDVDSIKYDLLIERFFNDARAGSLPDIDCDLQPEGREELIDYIRNKYGDECVAQMVTFGTLQGKGAIKEVLRVYKACSPLMMDEITKDFPDKNKIEGEMKEDDETSFIRHILRTKPTQFKDYCTIDDDDNLHGDLAIYFEKAIRIENKIKATGKHAAGVVICSQPIHNVCPMMYDKNSKRRVVGLKMEDAEASGVCKFDLLGNETLSKVSGAVNLINKGSLY